MRVEEYVSVSAKNIKIGTATIVLDMAQSVILIPMSSQAAAQAAAHAEEEGSPVGLRRRLHLLEQSIIHTMRLGEGQAWRFRDNLK